jgi:hypothetical protein
VPPYAVGDADSTSTGLPRNTERRGGRESQSTALPSSPGTVPLYSGVTTTTKSAAVTAARSEATACATGDLRIIGPFRSGTAVS